MKVEEIELSDRVKLLRYRKADGTTVLFDVAKRDRRSKYIHQDDNIKAIRFFRPEQDFDSFLRNESGGHYIYMGGYQWKWSGDCEYLIAYDGASGFVLENHEAKVLARTISGTQS
jgi:hypothetical protein